MSINYTELKAAMETAGYTVSEGDGWTASDSAQYRDYLYFEQNNVPPVKGNYGLEYTGILPEGFPGTGETPVRTLLSVAVTGTLTADVGSTSQLTATGTYDVEPLTEDITATATWVSATPANATVAAGLVTGVAAGTSAITAGVGEVVSAPATFTVTEVRALQSIAISGPTTVVEGETINLVATGTYNVAPTSVVITTGVAWASATEASATVGAATGVVTGVAAGSSNISCSLDGITAPNYAVTVTAA